MKTYEGVDVYFHIFLASALVGGEWSASPPGRFTPGKEPPVPLDRRLGGPQSQSEQRGEEIILDPTGTRTLTSRSSSPSPVAIPTTLSFLHNDLFICSFFLEVSVGGFGAKGLNLSVLLRRLIHWLVWWLSSWVIGYSDSYLLGSCRI
jgi:hypothetical protein